MEYNPFAPEVRQDPYPYYAELRRNHPVYRVEALGLYTVSRYDDVTHVVMHPELFSSAGFNRVNIHDRPTQMMVFADPPDHTRLRGLVNRGFTPKMVADLEPRIRQLTGELISRVAPAGSMDLIADLAMPLPVTIIAEILGVEPDRLDDFKRWSDNIIGQVFGNTGEADEEHQRVGDEMMEYFTPAIEARRHDPRGDLISALVRAEAQEQKLNADEVMAFVALLLVAGNETTTNLLGNAVIALLDHPDQLAKVRDDPSLVPNMVEEALRYESPVQFLFRVATQDIELAGTAIPKGTVVLPLFASANRDERKYPEAERFDVTRDASGHLAFGHGIHFCLGAPLARLEARIALEVILARLHNLERTEQTVELVDTVFLRGPKRLPLAFEPAPATAVVS